MKTKKNEALTLVRKIKETTESMNTVHTDYVVRNKVINYGNLPRIELRIYQSNYNLWDYFDLLNIDKIFKECGINDALTLGFIIADNESSLYFSYDIWYEKEEGE